MKRRDFLKRGAFFGGTGIFATLGALSRAGAQMMPFGFWKKTSAPVVSSVFCVTAMGGAAATSPDGVTWTTRTLPTPSGFGYFARWNGSIFCAIDVFSTTCATSSNGVSWTQGTLPSMSSWMGLAWDGTRFCAVASGSDKAATSTDGLTWTPQTLPSSADWFNIAFNGTRFVTIKSDATSAQAAYSSNGASWTAVTLPGPASAQSFYVVANGSKFVAISDTQVQMSSADGISWSKTTAPLSNVKAFTSNGTIFCAITHGSNQSAVSTDGSSWTTGTMPSTADWTSVAWNGSTFCAVAIDSNKAATSTDGLNWTARTLPATESWWNIT